MMTKEIYTNMVVYIIWATEIVGDGFDTYIEEIHAVKLTAEVAKDRLNELSGPHIRYSVVEYDVIK